MGPRGVDRNSLVDYLNAIERANLAITLRREARGIAALGKPDKIYLDNTNLTHALAPGRVDAGHLRETFFVNQLKQLTYGDEFSPRRILLPKRGDFTLMDGEQRYVFEVGGPSKTIAQVKGEDNYYSAVDELQTGSVHRIPLWMFGLMY